MPALFQVFGMILGMIVRMLVAGGVGIIVRFVIARDPGAEIDKLASLGAKRAKAIRRRHVSRFFAIRTGHRNSTMPSAATIKIANGGAQRKCDRRGASRTPRRAMLGLVCQ
jgi:hypothetical protein